MKPKKPGEKYEDYLKKIEVFIENYINKDISLIKLHKSFLDSDKHISDPENKLMAQNILYRILDGFWNTEDDKENKDNNAMNVNLNTILYGPPEQGRLITPSIKL